MSRYGVGLELGWSSVGVRLESVLGLIGVGLGLQGPGWLGLEMCVNI